MNTLAHKKIFSKVCMIILSCFKELRIFLFYFPFFSLFLKNLKGAIFSIVFILRLLIYSWWRHVNEMFFINSQISEKPLYFPTYINTRKLVSRIKTTSLGFAVIH